THRRRGCVWSILTPRGRRLPRFSAEGRVLVLSPRRGQHADTSGAEGAVPGRLERTHLPRARRPDPGVPGLLTLLPLDLGTGVLVGHASALSVPRRLPSRPGPPARRLRAGP